MIKDERIEQARNQIWAEMMQILYFIAILSFVVKILFLHQSLQDCTLEYVVLILTPIYQMIRARQMGTFVVVFLVVQFGMYRMGKRRQEQLEKEYDDEE